MGNPKSNPSNVTPQPTNPLKPTPADQAPATGNPGQSPETLAGLLAACLETALKAGGDAKEVASRAAACAVSQIVGGADVPVSPNPGPEAVKSNPGPGQPSADK